MSPSANASEHSCHVKKNPSNWSPTAKNKCSTLMCFVKNCDIVCKAHRYPDTLVDRGYNKANCLGMTSKVTGKQAEWLGHLVGCLVEDKVGYVLIEEFKVTFLKVEEAAKLRELAKKYTLPDEVDWNEQL